MRVVRVKMETCTTKVFGGLKMHMRGLFVLLGVAMLAGIAVLTWMELEKVKSVQSSFYHFSELI